MRSLLKKPEYGKVESGIKPSAFDPQLPGDRELRKPGLHRLLQQIGESMPGCSFVQLWDHQVICESPSKVPFAQNSVEIFSGPSLEDQIKQLIVPYQM